LSNDRQAKASAAIFDAANIGDSKCEACVLDWRAVTLSRRNAQFDGTVKTAAKSFASKVLA
jgi:hypothetical protein